MLQLPQERASDCWSKGGGKEVQGPRSKDRKEKRGQEGSKGGQKDSVNTASEEDGVWMAVTSDSNNENMADNEFDDFMVSDDDLFIYKDKYNKESKVPDLATHLKKLLKIFDTAKNPILSYDNPTNILNTRDLTDSSNNKQGAVAMQISSEFDSKVEIDPYWSKITVNEL
jgi:hypothetical protein